MKKQNGFFQAPNRVFDKTLSCSEKLVIIYLYKCRNTDTGLCNPSYKNIASSCSIERKTAIRAISKLTNQHVIEKVRTGKSNHYSLPNMMVCQ